MDNTIPQDDTPRKRCPRCTQWKPLTSEYFLPNHKHKGKFYPPCRVCDKQGHTAQRRAHPERERQYQQQYYQRTYKRVRQPQNDSILLTPYICKIHGEIEPYICWYSSRRKSGNTHLFRRLCPLCKEASEEKYRPRHLERRHQWGQENPELERVYRHARRARLRNAQGSHTAQDIQEQHKRQKGKCYWCGSKLPKRYHIDHVIPLSRGGSNDASNLVIACQKCNLSKHDRLPHEWPRGGRLL